MASLFWSKTRHYLSNHFWAVISELWDPFCERIRYEYIGVSDNGKLTFLLIRKKRFKRYKHNLEIRSSGNFLRFAELALRTAPSRKMRNDDERSATREVISNNRKLRISWNWLSFFSFDVFVSTLFLVPKQNKWTVPRKYIYNLLNKLLWAPAN